MKRLDEEMHLNSFLFEDIEQSNNKAQPISEETKEITKEKTSYEKKKEYILRRAQIMVYQYGKKREMYKGIMFLAYMLLAVEPFVLLYLIVSFVNGVKGDYRHIMYICLSVGLAIAMSILGIACRRCMKKYYNICQEIYSMTVKFQTCIGSYSAESKQMNLEMYVVELEKYLKKGWDKKKQLE